MPPHASISQRSQPTTADVAGPAAPKRTASAARAACFVDSGTGPPGVSYCFGVSIFTGIPAPVISSHVASTTSTPMPSPGSATIVFMSLRLPLHRARRQTLHDEALADEIENRDRDRGENRAGHQLAPDVLIAHDHHRELDRHRHRRLVGGEDQRE